MPLAYRRLLPTFASDVLSAALHAISEAHQSLCTQAVLRMILHAVPRSFCTVESGAGEGGRTAMVPQLPPKHQHLECEICTRKVLQANRILIPL